MTSLVTRGESGIPPYVPFDVLNVIALTILFLTILPPLFSKSVHRIKTWFALLFACIFCCISFLLLLGQQEGKEPSLAYCAFSAGMIYAAPPAVAGAGLGFVIELCLRLLSALSLRAETEQLILEKRIIYLLLLGPIAHAIVFWVSVFVGLSNTSLISRHPSGMYCRIDHPAPTLLAGVTMIVLLLIMLAIQAYTVVGLVRKRRIARSIKVSGTYFPLSLFIRFAGYTVIGGLALILVTVLVNAKTGGTDPRSYVALYFLAVEPMSVGVLFGTQVDILQTYFCFWKKRRPHYIYATSQTA